MMAYKDIVPIGTSLIIGSTCFGLELSTVIGHMILTLYGFMISLKHSMPLYVIINNGGTLQCMFIIHYAVGLLGLIGHFIKLYKPDEDAKYFEYGSLGLFMVGVVIYLTNLRTGVNSCLVGQWGDVDYKPGSMSWLLLK